MHETKNSVSSLLRILHEFIFQFFKLTDAQMVNTRPLDKIMPIQRLAHNKRYLVLVLQQLSGRFEDQGMSLSSASSGTLFQ
jgi:hypothetical protein